MENERRIPKEEPSLDVVGRPRSREEPRHGLDEAQLLSRVPSLRIERNPAVSSRDPPPQTTEANASASADEGPSGTTPETTSRSARPTCSVSEIWLRTGEGAEIQFGWYRRGMPNAMDAFFAAMGAYQTVTRDYLAAHRVMYPPASQQYQLLHPGLHRMVRLSLRDPNFVADSEVEGGTRPISGGDWSSRIQPGFDTSLPYAFACEDCQLLRVVPRTNFPRPESLSRLYRFFCRDVGAECEDTQRRTWMFLPTRVIPGFPLQAYTSTPLPQSALEREQHPSPSSTPPRDNDQWRKKMKDWAGAVTYDGSASLVELKGWETSLKEAFDTLEVPLGRAQVLQGIHFLRGEAEKWWKGIAGQPQGQALRTIEALSEALQRRLIPRSVYMKAMDDWSTLRQTGTAEEYMRRVDELAVLMPLGQVAEYAHALRGMRPEIRAEIQFRMEEQGLTSCSREELWRHMWLAETRYPYKPPKPFFARPKPRPPPTKVSSADASSFIICWVCDSSGHRANVCSKRHSSGCARCGSKAHNLMMCPQRPTAKKGSTGQGIATPDFKRRPKEKNKGSPQAK